MPSQNVFFSQGYKNMLKLHQKGPSRCSLLQRIAYEKGPTLDIPSCRASVGGYRMFLSEFFHFSGGHANYSKFLFESHELLMCIAAEANLRLTNRPNDFICPQNPQPHQSFRVSHLSAIYKIGSKPLIEVFLYFIRQIYKYMNSTRQIMRKCHQRITLNNLLPSRIYQDCSKPFSHSHIAPRIRTNWSQLTHANSRSIP